MNLTTSELTKQMEAGKILSEDFLPKFGAQLQKQFGPGVAKATHSLQSSLTEMSNKIILLKTKLGTDFLPVIMKSLEVASGFFDLIKGATDIVQKNGFAFSMLGGAVAAYVTYTKAATVGTALLEGAIWLLDAAAAANPIGIMVASVAALAAGAVYAWNKFEGFRGFLYGFASSTMQLFRGLGNVIAGAFTINPAQLSKGVAQLTQITQKYQEGYANGVKAFRSGKEDPGATPDEKLAYGNNQIPGTSNTNVGLADAKGKSGGAAGAGRGVTNITIQVHQLVGQSTVHVTHLKEGVDAIKTQVQQALLSVLNDANAMTTAS
jgi:hypothetical protein